MKNITMAMFSCVLMAGCIENSKSKKKIDLALDNDIKRDQKTLETQEEGTKKDIKDIVESNPSEIASKVQKVIKRRTFQKSCENALYTVSPLEINLKEIKKHADDQEIDSVIKTIALRGSMIQGGVSLFDIDERRDLWGDQLIIELDSYLVDVEEIIDLKLNIQGVVGSEINKELTHQVTLTELDFKSIDLSLLKDEQFQFKSLKEKVLKDTKKAIIKIENEYLDLFIEVNEKGGEALEMTHDADENIIDLTDEHIVDKYIENGEPEIDSVIASKLNELDKLLKESNAKKNKILEFEEVARIELANYFSQENLSDETLKNNTKISLRERRRNKYGNLSTQEALALYQERVQKIKQEQLKYANEAIARVEARNAKAIKEQNIEKSQKLNELKELIISYASSAKDEVRNVIENSKEKAAKILKWMKENNENAKQDQQLIPQDEQDKLQAFISEVEMIADENSKQEEMVVASSFHVENSFDANNEDAIYGFDQLKLIIETAITQELSKLKVETDKKAQLLEEEIAQLKKKQASLRARYQTYRNESEKEGMDNKQ